LGGGAHIASVRANYRRRCRSTLAFECLLRSTLLAVASNEAAHRPCVTPVGGINYRVATVPWG
jgi:hypothetical protein